jgi:hypothetical protein
MEMEHTLLLLNIRGFLKVIIFIKRIHVVFPDPVSATTMTQENLSTA